MAQSGSTLGRRRHGVLALLSGAALLWGCGPAWVAPPSAKGGSAPATEEALGRRGALGALGLAGLAPLASPEAALASGGSTAGKYSTIPSAKRRFFGRVRQGIYQFLLMEEPISKGELQDENVVEFFAKNIVKQEGGKKIKGCQLSECVTKEKRTSRWLDFKISADLLASAFRYSADDVADYLPQVKLIRAYAKKVDKLDKAIAAGEAEQAKTLFAQCKLDLSRYVPMVELSPLDSEDYTHSWDTKPQVWCQGSFCV